MNTELLYVWIGENESGFIKNQGFHFSPAYRFEMKYLEKEGEYRLDCIRNEDYPNIWKRDNLCGLTAVVGENGTGKTSLMKTLLSPFTEESKLMVYTVGDRFLVWNLLNQKVRYWSDEVCENWNSEIVQPPIYMTNAQGFQLKYWEGPLMFFTPDRDISNHFVAGFVESEPMQMPERFVDLYGNKKNLDFSKLAIVNYYYHQFQKTNEENDEAPVSLLKVNSTLSIGVSRTFESLYRKVYNKIKNDRYGLDGDNILNERIECLRIFRDMFRNIDSFVLRLWLIIVVELCYISGIWDFPPYDPRNYANYLLDIYKKLPFCEESIVIYYEQAFEELEVLWELLKPLEADAFRDPIVLSYDKTPEVYTEFCKFISGLLYEYDSFVLRNLSIDLSELSSGERALQNICAWLVIASNSVMRASILQDDNILLLLDEVDLYMHPEWQRKFLYFLEKELKLQFSDYKIQIVITTHSPLVLSDVPSGNIIYLGRKSNHCTVDGGPEIRETFGANIFTLMKDSFYLERSLGEFAYQRIRGVIDDLQILRDWNTENPSFAQQMIQEKYSYEEYREKCRNHKPLIGIIGEPVVRNKLQRLYAELFAEGSESHYEKHVKDIRSVLQTMSTEEHQRFREELSSILAQMKDDRD